MFLTIIFYAPDSVKSTIGVHTDYGMFTQIDDSKLSYFKNEKFEVSDEMVLELWKNPPRLVE